MNTFPVEEFLPGEGFEEDARNLLLLTRDCVGNYKLIELEDSLVYASGTEGSEKARKHFRPWMNHSGVVKVDKTSAKKWEVDGLQSFCPAGCLRHVYIDEDENKVTDQDWIEGNNLVTHGFIEWGDSEETDCEDHEEEEAQDDSDVIDKEKVGVEHRAVITFYKENFVYKESYKENCSYEYKIEASFAKI